MNLIDARTVPVDPESGRRLRDAGFAYRIVDLTDDAAAGAFVRADARGFLDEDPDAASVQRMTEAWATRRNTGVYETDASAHDLPIATVNAWVTPMTVPGGEIPLWAISSVTVAATHRRRGIARNLLEGELRAAASAGVPAAGLTASEATIYSRYGFAPAVPVARVAIDTRRAGWAAGASSGRLEYIERDIAVGELEAVHERSRPLRSGQVPGWQGRWKRAAGLGEGPDKGRDVRSVRHVDAQGRTTGILTYTLKELPGEFRSILKIMQLVTETDEALRALWGFAVNHDLVNRVEADLRPVDDPIPYLVADQRAVEFAVHDHGWLRVLDVPAVLRARRYQHASDVTLRVEDPYGFATGTWRLTVGADGTADVEPTHREPAVSMAAATFSAAYAGGVALSRLAAAGRVDGDAAAIASLTRTLLVDPAPQLGIWY
ncbi:GNAT family N-acetyltransferase [Microbacterium sp. NPDC058342]|uniref:GNAT family N-acetyltransferase n=1 Tax=Microbacterium sp. NPDC058342 TaxID=3346454 RepID=UPI00366305C8